MRILIVGDVVAQPGVKAIKKHLARIRHEQLADLVIVNGENAAGGLGITKANAHDLFAAGVDVITSGNHVWNQWEIVDLMEEGLPILRPLNYPQEVPGMGYTILDGVLVVNLLGRTHLELVDCPFTRMAELLERLADRPLVSVIDFHALEPIEKVAMGWFMDGQVSAVIGTHTHIPTADARLLPGGTAFVSDIGMVGPYDAVVGIEVAPAITRFLTRLPPSYLGFKAASGPVVINAVLVDVDDDTGRANQISRVDEVVEV